MTKRSAAIDSPADSATVNLTGGDVVATLVRRITLGIALLTGLATFFSIFFLEPLGDRTAQYSRLAIPASVAVSAIIGLFFVRRNQLAVGVGIVIAAALISVSYHNWHTDLGMNAYSFALFASLCCASALLIGPRAGIAVTIISIAIVVAFFVGDTMGGRYTQALVTGRLKNIGPTNNLLIYVTLLLSTGLISVYFSRQFRLALQESSVQEQRFREIFNATPQACMVHRSERILLANDALRLLCGTTDENSLEGQTPQEIYARLKRAAPPNVNPESDDAALFRVIAKNGERRFVFEKNSPVQLADGEATFTMLIDKTDEYIALVSLQEAKEAADAASRAKTMFLANMSHEIRTPLNGIMGLTELSLDPAMPHEKRLEYARMVLDSSNSLLGILSDVLDLSKIEAGKVQLEPREFDLHQMLGSVHHSFASLAGGKGLVTKLTIAPATPRRIIADPTRLRQVISNLIHNAIKFTENGQIDVMVSTTTATMLKIDVKDTGIGIPEDTLALLFRPFVQADNSTTRRFGGTGLGLALCKQLTELMGGHVSAASREGAGTTFTVALPFELNSETPIAAVTQEALRVPGLRVLLVEDNLINQTVLKAMLIKAGALVATASDGQEALDLVAGKPFGFDIVLLDLQMPGMDGFEVATELRKTYTITALPILALTASVLAADRERTAAVGFNDYLPKPIPTEKLIGALKQWTSHLPKADPA